MTIFNLGSINIDHVYRVPHFPAAGETLATGDYMRTLGGKGANQSIALAKAGAPVCHLGAANPDDRWLLELMADYGVDITNIQPSNAPTGHAIVSVNNDGENQILLYAGANHQINMDSAIARLDQAGPDDWVLLQNETNNAPEFVAAAKRRGLKIAYSAAPFDADIALGLLPDCDLLIVNEGEADALAAATGSAPDKLGLAHLVITKGGDGADYFGEGGTATRPAFDVEVVDTTGAGDCFYGYFLAAITSGHDVDYALTHASAAAAIQVTKQGASNAIPSHQDVALFIDQQQGLSAT